MGLMGEFRKFALRGSLVDLAVGFTVGAAFTSVARSLVDDVLMPPIGLLMGDHDVSELYLLLRAGETAAPYASLADAQAAGAVTLNYGLFINSIIAFLLVAAAMFLVIRGMNKVERQLERESGAGEPTPDEPENKKCPYCLTTVPFKATRCPRCTSQLAGTPVEAP